tara:strand:- start:94 stop:336 length:243 start_codon:yes stop_codon:yes gene_type:complete
MKTRETKDQENNLILISNYSEETKIYTIRTSLTYFGLTSKLYCNNIFIKNLGKRKLKFYDNEIYYLLHNQSINTFTTKFI